jgi:hypothetical protein
MLRGALVDNQIMEGLRPELYRLVESCGVNAQTINHYLKTMRNELSLSIRYKEITIRPLAYLSKFHSNKKFKKMET